MCNQQSYLEDTYLTWGLSQATLFKPTSFLGAAYNQSGATGFQHLALVKVLKGEDLKTGKSYTVWLNSQLQVLKVGRESGYL